MTLDECKKKIGDKIECLKETRSTGKHIIEVNMSQGGIGSVTFYTAFPEINCKRKAIFAGITGNPMLLEKQL